MTRTASCQCGSLRVITSGTPANSYLCHCIACQRRTGAIVHSGAHYHKDQLRFEGESKIYAHISDTALKFVFIFVPIAAPQFIGRQINILINVGSPWAALPTRNFLRRRAPYGRKASMIG